MAAGQHRRVGTGRETPPSIIPSEHRAEPGPPRRHDTGPRGARRDTGKRRSAPFRGSLPPAPPPAPLALRPSPGPTPAPPDPLFQLGRVRFAHGAHSPRPVSAARRALTSARRAFSRASQWQPRAPSRRFPARRPGSQWRPAARTALTRVAAQPGESSGAQSKGMWGVRGYRGRYGGMAAIVHVARVHVLCACLSVCECECVSRCTPECVSVTLCVCAHLCTHV